MIPKNESYEDVKIVRHPTYTYQLDFDKKRIVRHRDGLLAMEQFVFKALQTNRYAHEIYGWDYGFEVDDLIGKPVSMVKSRLPKRIKDALITDDRVSAVNSFVFTEPEETDKKTVVCISFTVHTIFGSLNVTKEVEF